MKPQLLRNLILVCLGLSFFSFSCKKTEDTPEPIPLSAKAVEDFTASVLTTVTLDGSASTGPENFEYTWIFTSGPGETNTEGEINLLNKNSAKATFEPKKNGVYSFTLRLTTTDGKFSEDNIAVTVSGVITLSGTLTSNVLLQDIEPDQAKPDYLVSSDLIVPDGKSIGISTTSSSTYIRIEVAETAGIEIKQGGSINLNNTDGKKKVNFIASTGWKGFLVNGGTLTLFNQEINNAGKSAFSGVTEAAAIIVINSGNVNLQNNLIKASLSYDILLVSVANGASILNNAFSFSKPIKAPIANLGVIGNNSYGTYDYIVLTTPGSNTTLGGITLSGKFFIDGDLTTSQLTTTNGSTIFMKSESGILATQVTITNTTFDGLGSAAWKGLAISGLGTISNSKIINGGSSLFNTGSFTSEAKAAIYFTGNGGGLTISNSEITDSKGYGIYDSFSDHIIVKTNNTFTHPALSAIRLSTDDVFLSFGTTPTNTFVLNSGTSAVELRSSGSFSSPWPSLGAGNYYLLTDNTVINTTLTLSPDVILKFKTGKSLNIISGGKIVAIGSASNPIIFDGETGTSGSWSGIFVDTPGLYNFEFCQIKNGGGSAIFGATEMANLSLKYTVSGSTSVTFKNNTVSGSAGYGVVVEPGAKNPGITDVANANIYSNNVSGDTLLK